MPTKTKTKTKVKVKEIDIKVLVQESANELLGLMGVDASIEVEEEAEGQLMVNIDSVNETGLLIGARGETLLSIQTILNLIIKGQVGEWKQIIVNVGDWRKKQEEYMESLASQSAKRARETERPQHLYNLNSAQRRIIHSFLTAETDLETLSEGEGRERFLIIRLKAKE